MKSWKNVGYPLLAGILFFLLWQFQFFHFLFRLKPYQLPLPTAIFSTLAEEFDILVSYGLYTLAEAVIGIVIGSAIGFAAAVIATFFPKWGYGGLLVITALNAVPIIALSPIMNLWFGDGLVARSAVVTVTTMAAMAFQAYKGLNHLPPHALDLMRSYSASEFAVFRSLRLPNCLPYMFTALKINATVGMIGAIVSEFFYSSRGLGYMLSNSVKIAKMQLGWACIILSALFGILLYALIVLVERRATRWHVSNGFQS